jgi:hypothetical protein
MKMFFRNSSLSSPTDTLYHTNLPNVRGEPGHYGSQRVCLRHRQRTGGYPLLAAGGILKPAGGPRTHGCPSPALSRCQVEPRSGCGYWRGRYRGKPRLRLPDQPFISSDLTLG